MPNSHSDTDVVGPEILACSGGHSTHQFAPPSVEKFGLENAREVFARASKISHPVTTRAAGNRFMLETDEHVIVDSGGEECISAGNIWRVNRLDRGHDPVMVTEVQHRTGPRTVLDGRFDERPLMSDESSYASRQIRDRLGAGSQFSRELC
ncbi:hypothetical protein GNZ12_30695 [Paraburkholderia sp. 1N]|uniref:Uncharacterized protein n=1 Tax=Paraburkholderia solitsugae TaxID=2675748 RepID=A0ABX2C0S5_9BURK|nr:hypothetical protein [Paraburkholderia solitsugae]NPT45615.1 hypothetical protein [Paraburkholderia solitsugae]